MSQLCVIFLSISVCTADTCFSEDTFIIQGILRLHIFFIPTAILTLLFGLIIFSLCILIFHFCLLSFPFLKKKIYKNVLESKDEKETSIFCESVFVIISPFTNPWFCTTLITNNSATSSIQQHITYSSKPSRSDDLQPQHRG